LPADAVRRFRGSITGIGTTSGVRVVVGAWETSPFGAFVDVMVAEADGTRRLLAPTEQVADFVAGTYTFDAVEVLPLEVRRDPGEVRVTAGPLEIAWTVGGRTRLGTVLRVVPRRVATAPGWALVTDPVARVALRGVRTRGSAGNGRTETYGATDHHRVVAVRGTWHGADLGALAPVLPEPGFGFGSTPPRPSTTALVTTVRG
jgi:hypothetical protein